MSSSSSRPSPEAATAPADVAPLNGASSCTTCNAAPPVVLDFDAINTVVAKIVDAAYAAVAAGEIGDGIAAACARAASDAVATITASLVPAPSAIVPGLSMSSAGSQDGDRSGPGYIKFSGLGLAISLLRYDGRPLEPDVRELRLRLLELVQQMINLICDFEKASIARGAQRGLQHEG